MKDFDALKKEYTDNTGYDIINWHSSTDGTASLTLVNSNVSHSDKCEVVFQTLVLDDGVKVHLSFVVPEEYGYDSVPSDCDSGKVLYGKRVGTLHLNSVLRLLPKIHTDKVTAETYLANNPDMLISKLSNVLNMQQKVMSEQNRILGNLDWDLSCVYDNATTKTKKFMKMFIGSKDNSGYLSKLKGLLNGDKFTN